MEKQYVIGIDFGTLSARASVFSIHSQADFTSIVFPYPCQVMSDGIFSGHACANPEDYIEALVFLFHEVLKQNAISPDEILAAGIDCTACSILPVTRSYQPIVRFNPNNPMAYIRLWKDHSAESIAKEMTALARERNEEWLRYCGGSISAEWMLPKLLQVYRHSPALCEEDILFMEAGDWLTAILTGNNNRSSSAAGFVGNRMEEQDFPSDAYLNELAPGFAAFVSRVTEGTYLPVGARAGEVTASAESIFGLNQGTLVCIYNVDAQAAFPAAAIDGDTVLAVMGTSTVYLMNSSEKKSIPGISCVVKDGILPGFYGYSAGQSCSGDMLDWYVYNAVPASVQESAAEAQMDMHQFLTEKASSLHPGETGLLALDWLGGNRAILRDMNLSGLILGLTRETKPWEIYRALAEASAFGSRIILERCAEYHVGTGTLYMSGGIPRKNPMIMQIYADVLGRDIAVLSKNAGPALGSAITALYAAGDYTSIPQAAKELIHGDILYYHPIPENCRIYDSLFEEYRCLHDYFGRGENNVMKTLRNLKERYRNDQ